MSDSFPLLHGLPEIHFDDLPQRDHMAAGARGILDNLLNRRLNQSNHSASMWLSCCSVLCGVPYRAEC